MSNKPAPSFFKSIFFLIWLLVFVALFAGWRLRDYHLISPKEGVGFALGIMVVFFMLLLLVYPLRKRNKKLSSIGTVKSWFRLHMIMGVLGPFLIVFHANFHWGALNSHVAMLSMLIVAFSGLFGRYFYGKIHHGLYGSKADLAKMQTTLGDSKGELDASLDSLPGIKQEIIGFLENTAGTKHGLAHIFYNAIVVPWRVRSYRNSIVDKISNAFLVKSREENLSLAQTERAILAVTGKIDGALFQSMKIAEFLLFDRLFALWHIFHVPFFFIMLATVIVHITTVLLY